MAISDILKICYLLGSLSFIVGLKMLSRPDSAKKGNLYAALGMTIAIIGTILFHENVNHETGEVTRITNLPFIFGAIAIGTVVGYFAAMKVKMTAMPQMVSLFNGMGGACAALIGLVEMNTHHPVEFGERLIIFLGVIDVYKRQAHKLNKPISFLTSSAFAFASAFITTYQYLSNTYQTNSSAVDCNHTAQLS